MVFIEKIYTTRDHSLSEESWIFTVYTYLNFEYVEPTIWWRQASLLSYSSCRRSEWQVCTTVYNMLQMNGMNLSWIWSQCTGNVMMNVVRTFKHKPIKVPYVYVSVVCGTISVRYVCEIPYLQLFYALACQFSVLHCTDLIHIPNYHLKQVLEFKCIIFAVWVASCPNITLYRTQYVLLLWPQTIGIWVWVWWSWTVWLIVFTR